MPDESFVFPFVSIIIPAKNEERDLSSCLRSLINQSYPADRFEILLVDNGSDDETVSIANSMGIRTLSAEGFKIGGVRNYGAGFASGEILAYIDADCVAPKNWLTCGVKLLENNELGAVGGKARVRGNATWVESAWALPQKRKDLVLTSILATGSFFITKKLFDQIGGFDEEVVAGEDTQISARLIKEGYMLGVSSNLSVVHLGFPRTIKEFMKRQFWQSSDYIKTKKSHTDKVFILVHVFTITVFSIPYFILNDEYLKSICSLSFTVVLALALATYRFYKSAASFDFIYFSQVFFLNYFYLSARMLGLASSYKKLFSTNFIK